MIAVISSDQLLASTGAVPTGPDYTTNFYISSAEIARGIEADALSVHQGNSAVLVLRRHKAFFRVYHVATNTMYLSSALRSLAVDQHPHVLISDLVGTPKTLGTVTGAYIEAGFSTYTRLLRMHRIGGAQPEWVPDSGVQLGTPSEAAEIHAFLNARLDPFSEQVPDVKQVADAAAAGLVLILRCRSALAGILIYETKGATTTLRYWQVDEKFRDHGIGGRLIRCFFHLCRHSRRILLWVIAGNDDAISKYQHYGFRADELIDDIVIKRAGH